MTYKIKKLKWEKSFDETSQSFRAITAFGSYEVSRFFDLETKKWEQWSFKWDFQEYYDVGHSEVLSAKEGKKMAEKDWLSRIEFCLVETSDVKEKCGCKIQGRLLQFNCGKNLYGKYFDEVSKIKFCPFCGGKVE